MRSGTAAAAVLAVLLCACTKVSTTGHLQGNAPTIPGVVRYAISNDLNTLNPVIGGLAYENAVEEAIFSGLVKIDDRERIIPDLATVVPSIANGGVSSDGRTITYHLRRDARWQDGQPVTSADVAFTFSKIMDPNVNAPNSAPYTHVAAVLAPDPETVVVRLKTPWAPAIGQLFCDGENGSIIPKHLLEHSPDFNRDPFGLHPIGSGAMRLARWDRGSRIVLVPNQNYFAGAPKIKELDVLIVPDANTRLTMLFSRDLDVVQADVANQVDHLRQLQGYKVMLVQYPRLRYLVFNLRRQPFSDPRVRQALTLALDRPRLARTVYEGTAVDASSFIAPFSWAYSGDNDSPPYDPAHAASLLTQAGWVTGPDGMRLHSGEPLAFTISLSPESVVASEIADQIQLAWRQIGADVAIQPLPLNVLRSPTGIWPTGKFDVELQQLIFDPDPDRSANLGSQFSGTRGFNDGRYSSALSDALTAQAVAVYPHMQRKPLYAQLQQLWNRDLPVVPIAWPDAIYVVNANLRGFRPEPVNSDFWNIQDWQMQ